MAVNTQYYGHFLIFHLAMYLTNSIIKQAVLNGKSFRPEIWTNTGK
jgi:hypothetical protein